MRTLAFDGRMGASGDMLLGALLAAGADPAVLSPAEDALDVEYVIGTTTRCGIEATNVSVVRTAGEDAIADHEGDDHSHDDNHGHDHDHSHEDDHGHSHRHEDDHGHSHRHEDDHGHSHRHEDGHDHRDGHSHDHDTAVDHEHTHAEGTGPHRTFPEVVELVESMNLPSDIESDATAIFELLGKAEASVHGTDLEETHFHEVGADDAIADVVGTALLLADIAPDRVVTTPLSTGGGETAMSHGVYPVPTPAVVEVAERADWSLRGGPVETELLTPTGAAILAHIAEGVENLPPLAVETSGYGAGDRSFERHPNVLRALVGEAVGDLKRDSITVLETNLDDATPETLGGLQETLLDAGARDVSVLPATMKKSRPGHLVKVIVRPADARRVARVLAAETGTLGIREHGAGHRFIASREMTTATVTVDGEAFEVAVKVATFEDGEVFDISGEYDDALAVARETGLPVREVLWQAERAVREEME